MGTWFRRVLYWLRHSRHDRELREEIEAHRALRAAHLERNGMTPQQADAESRRAIGNVLLAREDVRTRASRSACCRSKATSHGGAASPAW